MLSTIIRPLGAAAIGATVLSAALIGSAALPQAAQAADVVETAVAAGSFKTLVVAVQAAGLVDALQGPGPITVFAPSDEAFSKLPAGTVEELLKPENSDKLTSILLYHVVPGRVMAADAAKLQSAPTLLGQAAPLSKAGGGLSIASAKIVATDIECDNGVIHVIDSVMLPGTIVDVAAGAGTFKTLLAAAQATGLVDTLSSGGPFTVFAPTDEAFAELPAGTVESLLKPENREQLKAILLYHVVPGRVLAADAAALNSATSASGAELMLSSSGTSLSVNGAHVIAADLGAINGVVHVIDAVLLPPADMKAEHAGGCGH